MQIRETSNSDLESILAVETAAFGGGTEAELVRRLLADPSARPTVSLVAFEDDRAVGHILFTAARLSGHQGTVAVSLLAPLAVVPEAQGRGIGGRLIESGLQLLSEAGVGLVFYLDEVPRTPRERDYIYVASYFAFSLWIGLGAAGLMALLTARLHSKIAWLLGGLHRRNRLGL